MATPLFLFATLAAAQAVSAPQTTPATPPPVGATTPATGTAQAGPATVAVGAAVADQSGQPVGTISQINGDTVVLDTGTVKAGVPRAAVGPGPNGGLITTVTKMQIEAAASQSQGQLKSLMVAGSSVHASDGTTTLGTVKSADAQFVTVGTDKGDVRLPATAFAAQNGNLVTSLTADQFAAAVTQSLAAAPASPSSSSSTTTTETKTTSKSRRR